MTSKAKTQYGLITQDKTEHGYTKTIVTIVRGTRTPIHEELVRTIENRASYSDDYLGRRQKELARMIREGVTELFDHDYGFYLRVSYQHYKTKEGPLEGYCEPHVDVGSDPYYMQRTIPVFLKLAKAGFPSTPDALLAAFPRHVQVTYGTGAVSAYYVPPTLAALAEAAE